MDRMIYCYGFDDVTVENHARKITNIFDDSIKFIRTDSLDILPENACVVSNDLHNVELLMKLCKKATVILISDSITKEEGIKLGLYDVFKPDNVDLMCYSINNMLERQALLNEIYKYKSWAKFFSDISESVLYIRDLDGNYEVGNKNFLRISGLDYKDVIGKSDAWPWQDSEDAYNDAVQEIIETKNITSFNTTINTFEGIRHYLVKNGPILDIDNQVVSILSYATDVTEKIKEESKLNFVLENIPFAVAICDENRIYRNCNTYMKSTFGDVIGEKQGKLAANYTINEIDGKKEVIVFKGDIMNIFEMKTVPLMDNGIKMGEMVLLMDITERKHIEQKNREEAMTDVLTGLPNRRCLFEYYKSLKYDTPVSFLFMDIDDFKSKNDKYGHSGGDEFLKVTAQILKNTFKGEFIARLGGDEFVVCINHELKREELEARIRELRERGKWAYIEKQNIHESINFSIGVMHNALNGMSLDDLLYLCDDAMYEAKRKGKDTYVFIDNSKYIYKKGN